MTSHNRTDQQSHPAPLGDDLSATAGVVPGCVSRRQSFVVAGAAVAGTAGLTACGAAEDAVQNVASSAASAASSAAGGLIQAADIPVGGGKILDGIKVVVTQPTEGDFKAFSAICTHQQCTVSSVEDNVILCRCHLSEFDAATGAVRKGPATQPLPPKSVTVGADGLTIT